MWTLRVTGRRGRKRATVTRGRAWFGRNEARQPRYSAAPDQTRRHRRIARGLERRIERASLQRSEHVLDPDRVAERIRPDIRQIEDAPEPRPLTGIQTNVDEAHPRRGRDEQGRFALGYHLSIAPNSFEATLWANLREPSYRDEWANWDPRHDLLAQGQNTFVFGSAHDFGPYDLWTPEWDRARHEPKEAPRFKLRPEYSRYGGIGGANGRRRWAACTAGANIRAERLRWNSAQRQFERGPTRQDLVNERLQRSGMFAFMEDRRAGAAVARAQGGASARAQAIAGWRGGQEPRPLKGSLAAEDDHPESHIEARHVISARGMPSRRHVAWRAAFDQQVGRTGVDRGAPSSGGRNGAFESATSAMTALRLARNHLVGRWATLRDLFLPDTPAGELTGQVAATDTFAVDRIGERHPIRERPRYLQPVFRSVFTSRFQGVRPLYDQDVGSPEWRGWASRHRSEAQPARPLTRVVIRPRAFFLIRPTDDAPGTWYGWYVHTLYPVN